MRRAPPFSQGRSFSIGTFGGTAGNASLASRRVAQWGFPKTCSRMCCPETAGWRRRNGTAARYGRPVLTAWDPLYAGLGHLLSGSSCPIRTFATHLANGNTWSTAAALGWTSDRGCTRLKSSRSGAAFGHLISAFHSYLQTGLNSPSNTKGRHPGADGPRIQMSSLSEYLLRQ
jgi:hypothetical protein